MNYHNIYNSLIESRQQLNRAKNNDVYYENHHILPKSLGGTNKKENMVLLTAKEHYVAHLLLFKMSTGKDKAKMAAALFKMCSNNPNQNRYANARYYEFSKKLMSENTKGANSSFYGLKHSEETLERMRESKRGENNPVYGKTPWNKGLTKESSESMKKQSEAILLSYKNGSRIGNFVGKTHTEEAKIKMSENSKGKPKSESHKKKLSEANKGKTISDEVKQRISEKLKGRKAKTDTCQHCNKEMSIGPLNRWHNNNCKIRSI